MTGLQLPMPNFWSKSVVSVDYASEVLSLGDDRDVQLEVRYADYLFFFFIS